MKSGLSMVSIIIYVTLFFTFSTFAVSIGTNMNKTALSEKGEIIMNENISKLEYNIIKSSKASTKYDIISGKIVFSNNDEYYFDEEKKSIIKNGTTLIRNVESFEISNVDRVSENLNISSDNIQNFDKNIKNISLNITQKKYNIEKKSSLFVTIGDGINE